MHGEDGVPRALAQCTCEAWRLRVGPLHPRPAMQLGCLVHAVDEAAFHVRALLLGAAAHQVTHEHGDQVLSARVIDLSPANR